MKVSFEESKPNRYYPTVRALRYDGNAANLCGIFDQEQVWINLDENKVEIVTPFAPIILKKGEWIVCVLGEMQTYTDEDFRKVFRESTE